MNPPCVPGSIEPCLNNKGENVMLDLEWGSVETEVAREFSDIFADLYKGYNGGDIPLTVKIHSPDKIHPSTNKMNGYQPNLSPIQEEYGLQFYPVIATSEGEGFIILNTPISFCKITNNHNISCTAAEEKIETSSKVQDNEDENQVQNIEVLPSENMNEKEKENDIVPPVLVEETDLDVKKNGHDHEISILDTENSNQEEEELNNITTSSKIQELLYSSSSLPSSSFSLTDTQIMDDLIDLDSTLKAISSFDISNIEEFSFIDTSSLNPPLDETIPSAADTNNSNNNNNNNIDDSLKVHESKIFEPIKIKIEAMEDTESGYNSSSQHSSASPSSVTSSQYVEEPSSLSTSNNNTVVENIEKPGPKSRKRKLPSDFEGIIGVNLNYNDGSSEHTPLDMPLIRKSGRNRKPPSRYLAEDFQSVVKDKYQKQLKAQEKLKVKKVLPISIMTIKKEIIDAEPMEQPDNTTTTTTVKKARGRGRPRKKAVSFSV